MFTKAIVRTPGKSLVQGLSAANLGLPDYDRAIIQHSAYIQALEDCGLEVMVLPPLESFPDSTFIEDIALLTRKCAIITRPGALSRRGEAEGIRQVLDNYFIIIEEIRDPGTVEAGDILMVGGHFYIGLSERTNPEGAGQVIDILEKFGQTGSLIQLEEVLHLKTAVSYLENNNLIACSEMLVKEEFGMFNILPIEEDESYAANCIWVNGKVLIPRGCPKARITIQNSGYPVIEVDVSEFRKLDGGLSCLSLRF